MIIVLPAIGVLVQQAIQAVAVGAVIGAVSSAGVGAVVEGIQSANEQGEINQEVLSDAAHGALYGAKDGALIGGAFGPVSLIVGPLVGPVIGAAGSIVDDVAGPAGKAIGRAAKPLASAVDDAVGPLLGRVGIRANLAASSTGRALGAPYRIGRANLIARFYNKRQLQAVCSRGCVYIMDDSANGISKIGVSKDPAKRLVAVQNDVGSQLSLVGVSPVDDAFTVEAQLHRQLASKNVLHPNHATGREWFSGLSPMDVATVLSK